MELFKKIRLKIGDVILKNKIARSKRKIYYSSIDHVKNIGIVWDASKVDDFACLTKFYNKMHEGKTEVKILGYFPGKNLPNQYTAVRYLTILKQEELNIFYHPVSTEINTFVNIRFDVLIDLNFQKLLPLQFESEAGYAPFDLMMDLKNPNVEDYLNHVVHYLEMIKSGNVN
jgi:Cu2+-containing amine oxidase